MLNRSGDNRDVGIALWLGCGFAAWIVARVVPFLRLTQWLSELVLSLGAALAAGVGATALDFGGWNEPDWRAGAFAFACALAVIGWFRVARTRR